MRLCKTVNNRLSLTVVEILISNITVSFFSFLLFLYLQTAAIATVWQQKGGKSTFPCTANKVCLSSQLALAPFDGQGKKLKLQQRKHSDSDISPTTFLQCHRLTPYFFLLQSESNFHFKFALTASKLKKKTKNKHKETECTENSYFFCAIAVFGFLRNIFAVTHNIGIRSLHCTHIFHIS